MPECRSPFDMLLVYDACIVARIIHINDVARARRGALAGSHHAGSANTNVAIVLTKLLLKPPMTKNRIENEYHCRLLGGLRRSFVSSKFNGLPSRIWLNLKLDSSVKIIASEAKLV